jgi:hypothetical protein
MGKNIFLLFLFMLFGCDGKKNEQKNGLILETIKTINLNYSFSKIIDMTIDSSGNFIFVDGYPSNEVLVLSQSGEFIKKIGQKGRGPGEYSDPSGIAVNKSGDIYVADYLNNRINIYDKKYQYKFEIKIKNRIKHNIHINRKNEIYMYEGYFFGPKKDENTIFKYDLKGNEIISFAPLSEEVKKINFITVKNGMTIDEEDNIYEINPVYYRIRKYNADGKLLKTFAKASNSSFSLNVSKPTAINGPYYLKSGFIVIQIRNYIDIYKTNGDIILSEVPFEGKIVFSNGNNLYAEDWKAATNGDVEHYILLYNLKLKINK